MLQEKLFGLDIENGRIVLMERTHHHAHGFSADPTPGRRWVNERRPERWTSAVAATGTQSADAACLKLPAFDKARPENQPDWE